MRNPQLPDGAADLPRPEPTPREDAARRSERADLVRGVLARRRGGEVEDVPQPAHAEVLIPEPLPAAPQPAAPMSPVAEPSPELAEVTVDTAMPHALADLRTWFANDLRAHDELAARRAEAPNDRARARLDEADELDRALRDPDGDAFLRRLVDDVVRPDDLLASGFGMSDLAADIPTTLSPRARRLFRLGAFAGPGIPFVAVPLLRRAVGTMFGRELVPHDGLREALGRADDRHVTARIRPLGDDVVGNRGAEEVVARILDLIADPAVAEIDLDLDELNPVENLWDFEGVADRLASRFAGLLVAANEPGRAPTLLQLHARRADTLELGVETFMRALDVDGLEQARAGLTIPADFPESATLLRRLSGWAHLRHEDGGGPIRVGITRLADRAGELAAAKLAGFAPAVYVEDDEVDGNAVRLIDAVLAPDHRGVLELELDTTVPMDAALAVHLAGLRGAFTRVTVVVPEADLDDRADRLRQLGAEVRMRVALLPEKSLRPATRYLLARIAERAAATPLERCSEQELRAGMSPEESRLLLAALTSRRLPAGSTRTQDRVNPEDAPGITASIALDLFPADLFDDDAASSRDWSESFIAAAPITVTEEAAAPADPNATTILGREAPVAGLAARPANDTDVVAPTGTGPLNPADTGAAPNLTQVVLGLRRGRKLRNTFRNDPLSDPTQRSVRDWADRIRRRAARSELGIAEAREHLVGSVAEIRETLDRGFAAGERWSTTSGFERAAHLERLAKAIDANRARLIEVAMSETGLTLAEADADVSQAVDLANFDAQLARQLDRMQGARFEPIRLSVGVPGWIPPVSATAATIIGALAAGSAIVLKPSPRTSRTAAILARVCWSAELPEHLLQVAACDDRLVTDELLGRELITDARVERVLMQGAYETASRFLEWRPDLPLIGSSGGKSSVVVTPAADYDQAARAIAESVLSAGGQRPSRPSMVLLVGAASRAERFIAQLADAIGSRRFGYPADPSVEVGPLVDRATAKQLEALTELAEGEKWLLQPRPLDDAGRLWTPGIRTGVAVDSAAARNDAPVPVVNLVSVRTLDDAIRLQNELDYGFVAGLFSLDRAEIAQWVQGVEAGSLFVNRDVLGTLAQRQPVGGWKRSMIGTKLKSGGPNTLIHLGEWAADEVEQSNTLHLRGLEPDTQRFIEALQPSLPFDEFELVRRTALSCQIAWNEEFGEVVDRADLGVERNLFRYRPVECLIRIEPDATFAQIGQVLAAAITARAPLRISTAVELPKLVMTELALHDAIVHVEPPVEFLERMRTRGLTEARRLRLVGGSRREVCQALRNGIDIAVFSDDVTLAGRVEMLPFLREQSITLTAQRHGHPDDRVAELFPHERVAEQEPPRN